MAEKNWVVNASPLIALAKIGQLELLLGPSRILMIPEAVAEEIRVGPPQDPARVALTIGFGGTPIPVDVSAEVIAWGLGRGESAVLCLAAQHGATAVLDDRDARRAAKTMGLDVLGTLGVVLRARAEGRIESASVTLKALQHHGMRLDERLVATALRDAFGEIWEP
jgi:uncharacterized protein